MDLATVVLVALVAFDWYVTVLLYRIRRLDRHNTALTSRLFASTMISLATTTTVVMSMLGALGATMPPETDDFAVALIASIPQLNWLRLYYTNKF